MNHCFLNPLIDPRSIKMGEVRRRKVLSYEDRIDITCKGLVPKGTVALSIAKLQPKPGRPNPFINIKRCEAEDWGWEWGETMTHSQREKLLLMCENIRPQAIEPQFDNYDDYLTDLWS